MNPVMLYLGFRAAGPITRILGYLLIVLVIMFILWWFVGLDFTFSLIGAVVIMLALSFLKKRREQQIVQQRQQRR